MVPGIEPKHVFEASDLGRPRKRPLGTGNDRSGNFGSGVLGTKFTGQDFAAFPFLEQTPIGYLRRLQCQLLALRSGAAARTKSTAPRDVACAWRAIEASKDPGLPRSARREAGRPGLRFAPLSCRRS